MKLRRLGKTGYQVSEIGLGCWQLGGDFGPMGDEDASTILANAARLGINFWDTADVYGGGMSEHRIGTFFEKPEHLFVATKVGRNANLFPDKYTKGGVRESIEGSARRLCTDTLDLVQLHCVPPEILADGEIFTWLEDFQKQGLLRHFGASVETVDEGLMCLRQPGLATLQVIFNLFRQDAAANLFPKAQAADVGIIVRLPLASGLLSGKFTPRTEFAPSDHRHFNRDGEAFNVGETFSGLPFETGLELVDALNGLKPDSMPLSQLALRWILDHPAVSTVIAGASRAEQIGWNAETVDLPELPESAHEKLARFYFESVRPQVRGAI